MRIADVTLGETYVVDWHCANATRVKAVEIITRNEGTERSPRNVRRVRCEVTRAYEDRWSRHPVKVGDELVLDARYFTGIGAEKDAEEQRRRDRVAEVLAAKNALAEVGITATGELSLKVHLSTEDALRLAARLKEGNTE